MVNANDTQAYTMARPIRGVRSRDAACTAGFIPAFCDTATGRVEPSRLADGSPAPMHLLAGLPEEWIVARGDGNQVVAVKATVIAGFLRAGAFYTRAEAAQAVALH